MHFGRPRHTPKLKPHVQARMLDDCVGFLRRLQQLEEDLPSLGGAGGTGEGEAKGLGISVSTLPLGASQNFFCPGWAYTFGKVWLFYKGQS